MAKVSSTQIKMRGVVLSEIASRLVHPSEGVESAESVAVKVAALKQLATIVESWADGTGGVKKFHKLLGDVVQAMQNGVAQALRKTLVAQHYAPENLHKELMQATHAAGLSGDVARYYVLIALTHAFMVAEGPSPATPIKDAFDAAASAFEFNGD